jgi:hypothetical protein
MKQLTILATLPMLFAIAAPVAAKTKSAPAPVTTQAAPAEPSPAPVGKQVVEIYRIVSGQQEAFLRFIARCDEANRLAGLPPRQLFVHQDGADWDFMLIQPAETPKDKQAALDVAWTKLGMPSGADFFLAIRQYIASHTDTFVSGPTSAKDYLAGVTVHSGRK